MESDMAAAPSTRIVDRIETLRERNERLTQVGPGKPMGKYLRCFWHPIAATAELDRSDLSVLPVKLLGERLALFRTDNGELGLIQERCPHRGAPLSYGMVEE